MSESKPAQNPRHVYPTNVVRSNPDGLLHPPFALEGQYVLGSEPPYCPAEDGLYFVESTVRRACLLSTLVDLTASNGSRRYRLGHAAKVRGFRDLRGRLEIQMFASAETGAQGFITSHLAGYSYAARTEVPSNLNIDLALLQGDRRLRVEITPGWSASVPGRADRLRAP